MKFIHGGDIARNIQAIEPRKVAVAFLGQDWETYLPSYDALECIVVSPTFGTNPHAVADLVKRLGSNGRSGWERLHFLDDLHAKVYLGREACVVGSANLTANGLSGERLVEAAFLTSDALQLAAAAEFFDDVVRRAQHEYPDAQSKRHRLQQLFAEQAQRIGAGAPDPDPGSELRTILDLADPLPAFHICWFTADGPSLKAEVTESPRFDGADFLHFREKDNVKPGDWILTWRLTDNQEVDMRTTPSWMFVDAVRHNAIDRTGGDKKYPYTKVAFEYRRKPAEKLELLRTAPFMIDKAFHQAMKEVLKAGGDIRNALVQPNCDNETRPWMLKTATSLVPSFVQAMQSKLKDSGR